MYNSSICLCMIVKDEVHVLKECFDSLFKYINYWVICDTGSTDGTPTFIQKYFDEKGIPGKLYFHDWISFGHNRSLAFQMVREVKGIDYIWVIDADDYIVNIQFPPRMTDDSYMLEYHEKDNVYSRRQLFKASLNWSYRGVVHEYAYSSEETTISRIPSVVVGRRSGSRNRDPFKYHKDAELLLNALKKRDDPDLEARYLFYLGQSYQDSLQKEKAIEAYLLCLQR